MTCLCLCKTCLVHRLVIREVLLPTEGAFWMAYLMVNQRVGIVLDRSAGLMGYFPTYLLGAMYACQIFKVHAPCLQPHVAYSVLKNKSSCADCKIEKDCQLHGSPAEMHATLGVLML